MYFSYVLLTTSTTINTTTTITTSTTIAIHWRGPKLSRRRLEVTEYTESDPSDPHYMEVFKRFIIYEVDEHKNRAIYREFLLEPTGALLEIFDARRTNANTASIFNNNNNTNTNMNIDEDDRDIGNGGEDNDSKESDHDDDEEVSEHTGDPRGYNSNGSPKNKSWLKGSAFPELRSTILPQAKVGNTTTSEEISQLDLEKVPLLPLDNNTIQHSHRSQYSNRSTSSHPVSGRKQQPSGPPPAALRQSPRDISSSARRALQAEKEQEEEEQDEDARVLLPATTQAHRRHLDEDNDVLF